jgi:20S proteasome alpha/beta subunit
VVPRIGSTSIDETNITTLLGNALYRRKRAKCEEYVRGRFGISYDDFLQHGKNWLPSNLFADAFSDVAAMKLNMQLVVTGFTGGFPFYCETDDYCGISIREHFAVAGEGRHLAEGVFRRRGHTDVKGKAEALYTVYEAKKFAEGIPSVGTDTTISLIFPDGRIDAVRHSGRQKLDLLYSKYGPQEFTDIEFDGDHFVTVLRPVSSEGQSS